MEALRGIEVAEVEVGQVASRCQVSSSSSCGGWGGWGDLPSGGMWGGCIRVVVGKGLRLISGCDWPQRG